MNEKDIDIDAALIKAAGNGQTETVKLLIEKGADVNVKNKSGGTALESASFCGHTDIIKLLKKAGANKSF